MVAKGLPDLYAQHPKRRTRMWIEVKGPRGRLSAAQQRWHEIETAAGGLVLVAHDAGHVHDVLTDIRNGYSVAAPP